MRYNIEELVYINGLPYYRFDGYGINTRGYIDGYALAINIDDSTASEQLLEQHSAFGIEWFPAECAVKRAPPDKDGALFMSPNE